MADLRDVILTRLDRYADDHTPMDPDTGCCPGGCIADAAAALRALLELHRPGRVGSRELCLRCMPAVWPCAEVRAIAEALRIPVGEVTGRG